MCKNLSIEDPDNFIQQCRENYPNEGSHMTRYSPISQGNKSWVMNIKWEVAEITQMIEIKVFDDD